MNVVLGPNAVDWPEYEATFLSKTIILDGNESSGESRMLALSHPCSVRSPYVTSLENSHSPSQLEEGEN